MVILAKAARPRRLLAWRAGVLIWGVLVKLNGVPSRATSRQWRQKASRGAATGASGRKPRRINSPKTSQGGRRRRSLKRTVAEPIPVKELAEMFGQGAGGVPEMEEEGREHFGQRHARAASAAFGQDRQDRAPALLESSGKTRSGGEEIAALAQQTFFSCAFLPQRVGQTPSNQP